MSVSLWAHCLSGSLHTLALGLALCALPVKAATITVSIEVNDRDIVEGGTLRFVGSPSSRVGHGYDTGNGSVSVLPFKLPALPPGERVVSATLTVNLEGWYNYSSQLGNVDLYGVSRWSGSSTVQYPGDFIDENAPPSPDNLSAFRLQDNLITPADTSGSTGSGLVKPKSSADFGWFIQTLYDDGAAPGQYGFLTLAHDSPALNLMRYYILTAADSTTLPKPVITLTTGTANRTRYLDPVQGNDLDKGSAMSPWQTFRGIQPQLQPGDTVHCTGELGRVDMHSMHYYINTVGGVIQTGTRALGPDGLPVYTPGTSDKWIAYKAWPARNQPHIAELVFNGDPRYADIKRNSGSYLSFDGFYFYPGKVDGGNYVTGNAINLYGGWYVKFTGCTIEGATLDVPDSALASSNFKPYVPSAPSGTAAPYALQVNATVSSGAPGDASYITVENCSVKNSGIGIMVQEHYAYPTTRQSRYWTIRNNDIANAAEDGLRFGGADAGAGSLVSGNTIRDQNYYQSMLAWYGYTYTGTTLDTTAFNGKKWKQVVQVGTGSTGIVYAVEKAKGTDIIGDIYMKFYILADDRAKAPFRNTSNSWVLVGTGSNTGLPEIRFEPRSEPVLNAGGQIVSGTTPVNGDSAHTDCIAVMGKMTNGVFEKNRCRISEWGGQALKIENIPLQPNSPSPIPQHPTNLVFKNNLFYSTGNPPIKSSILLIAGGTNCYFYHNTIFGGPDYNLNGAVRFGIEDMLLGPNEGVHFRNNIIGGGGLTDVVTGTTVATSDYNVWMGDPPSGTNAKTGMKPGSHDSVPYPTQLPRETAIDLMNFVDPAAGDLRITSLSRAENKGYDYGEPYGTRSDFNDFNRSAEPDAGAFEVGSSPTPTPAPVLYYIPHVHSP